MSAGNSGRVVVAIHSSWSEWKALDRCGDFPPHCAKRTATVAGRCFAPVRWLVDRAVGRVAWSRSLVDGTDQGRAEP
jgi:hypothetical protein